MKITKICSSVLSALVAIGLATGSIFSQDTKPGAKEDIKDAGRSTKRAVKKTGSAVKKTAKKATHETAEGTEKVAKKVKDKTK